MPGIAVITNRGRQTALEAITSAAVAGAATVLLVNDGHDFGTNPDFVDSITGDEISATGYARVAATFGGIVVQADGRVTQEILTTDFGLVGGAVDATVGGCYLFADTGDDATSPVFACVPFTTTPTTDGTQLTIEWPPVTMTFSPSPL